MSNTASLKKEYAERIAPALKSQFQYSSTMQIPVLKKIVINQGLGMAVADKKIIEVAINEMTAITGQKAVVCKAKKSVANFKLREGMPIGCKVTLRGDKMYEFADRLINLALPVFGSTGFKFEMWIEASCFTIPPCGFFAFGFVLLDTILIPSTNARPSLTRTFNTRPVLPLSSPAFT